MRAMVFEGVGQPLTLRDLPIPEPDDGELLLRVHACGICRTDLHLLDGEVTVASPPRVLGHQIVATSVADGRRVGIPWLGFTCGQCAYCLSGRENLCESAQFTGCDRDGGMAEYCVADARFCFPLPDDYPDLQAAPLLCAGLIGYRALRMCGDAARALRLRRGRPHPLSDRPCPGPRGVRVSSSLPTAGWSRPRWQP
jgi:propanol-preferring alcohol dehydrogenase